MAGNLIATTPKMDMHALAFQGIMVYTCFPQIRDMLRRKFGDEYVLLFAEPVENAPEGVMDWYSPVQGEARPLASLPESVAAPVYERVAAMARDIQAYAEELVQTREPLKVTRGNILKLALCYPGNEAVYMVGEQPVYTCWGFGPGTPGAEPRNLMRLAAPVKPPTQPKTEEPPAAPVTEAPKAAQAAQEVPPPPQKKAFGWGWLWWLWPLAAALLLFLLLFSSFGAIPALSGISLFHFPGLPFDLDKSQVEKELRENETAVLNLREKAAEHAALCKPAAPQKAEQLIIPENSSDISFLEGVWHCETGLANVKTGEPVQVTFEFDRNGNGTATVNEQRGQCKGPAKAEMLNNKLHITADEQICPGFGAYNKVTIDCENVGNGTTRCDGINMDGSRWDATFLKLK